MDRSKSFSFSSLKKTFFQDVTSTVKLLRKSILWAILVFILTILVLLLSEHKGEGRAAVPTPEPAVTEKVTDEPETEQKGPAPKVGKIDL